MQNKIWNELDHRLSVVKRWGTAETIHKQSVAEHIFNVERIAVRIAKEWFNVSDYETLFDIIRWAHHHEDFETLSGDFPTMVKPYFDEDAFASEHSDLIKPRTPRNDLVRRIVKLADMLDSWWFLCVERTLGSIYLIEHSEFEPGRIVAYVKKEWPHDKDLHRKVGDLIHDMAMLKSTRHSRRGR